MAEEKIVVYRTARLKVCCKGQLCSRAMHTMMSTVISKSRFQGLRSGEHICTEQSYT